MKKEEKPEREREKKRKRENIFFNERRERKYFLARVPLLQHAF